ncbi:unnamed protein product, partial [Meganyctiphanes norvegica]
LVCLYLTWSLVLGSPVPDGASNEGSAEIIRDERVNPQADSGSYSFVIETDNGIKREEKSDGTVVTGSYSFVHPDGTVHVLRYIADKDGYRPQSDMLPTPPPMPEHAVRQVEFARSQREQGERRAAVLEAGRQFFNIG